jgi:hypothetical protein
MQDGKDLVTLCAPPSEFEANLLAIVLRDHDIEAFVFASPAAGIGVSFSGGKLGVPLQVSAEDLEKARHTLAANRRDSIDIDWDELGLEGGDGPPCLRRGMPPAAKLAAVAVALAALTGLVLVVLQLSG